jgi:hypothetical protein
VGLVGSLRLRTRAIVLHMPSLPRSLEDFVEKRDGTTASVIIEVATAPVMPPKHILRAQPDKRRSRPSGIDEQALYDEVGRKLGGLDLSAEPVRLERLRSFVADVTAEQLLQIAELPMVAAIRPNQVRRAPRPKAGRGSE